MGKFDEKKQSEVEQVTELCDNFTFRVRKLNRQAALERQRNSKYREEEDHEQKHSSRDVDFSRGKSTK